MQPSEDQINEKYVKNVNIAIEILFSHTNRKLIAFLADIM